MNSKKMLCKRSLYFFVMAVIMFAYTSNGFAQYGKVGERIIGGVRYALYNYYGQDLTANIIGWSESLPENLVIPEKILISENSSIDGWYPVTNTWSGAFSNCSRLKTVTIDSRILDVSSNTFSDCINLESVTWPESVEWQEGWGQMPLAARIFKGCVKLKNVRFPQEMTYIDDSAFEGCHSLEHINLPPHLTTIGSSAFKDCINLKEINFPPTLDIIWDWAFQNCKSLSKVILPNTLNDLRREVFEGCTGIKEVVIEDGTSTFDFAEYWGNGDSFFPFKGCNVEKLYLGRPVVFGSPSPFSEGFSTLKELEVGEAVVDMSDFGTFSGCSELETVKLPETYKNIGQSLFSGCKKLKTINIPAATKVIWFEAFKDCSSLTNMDLPEGLYYIGGEAFRNCSSLVSVSIPSTLTILIPSAFKDCSSLERVSIAVEDPSVINKSNGWKITESFIGINPDCMLYVPRNCSQSYAKNGWNNFRFIRENDTKWITNTNQIQNGKAYRLAPESVIRGVVYANPNNNYLDACGGETNYRNPSVSADYSDPYQQFSLYRKDGEFYLYNIGQKKFVNSYEQVDKNVYFTLSEYPGLPVSVLPSSVEDEFLLAIDGDEWINVSQPGCVGNWYEEDGGNRFLIVEADDVSDEICAEIENSFEHQVAIRPIKDISQISNDKCYVLMAEDSNRGVIYAHEGRDYLDACGGMGDYRNTDIEIDFSDPNQQFVLYESNGSYYLYSIGQRKFVSHYETLANHVFFMLNSVPMNSISFYPSSVDGEFIIALDDSEWINVNDLGCVGNWYIEDGGNRIRIIEVGDAPADVLNEIAAAFDNTTALPVLCNARDKGQFFDLQGRRIVSPQAGVNIVRYSDGSTMKVLLK